MQLTGWRAAAALLLGLAVLALLLAVALWVALALGIIAAVLWLNLVLLPRVSRRLHVPRLGLELACLPILGGLGWLLGGGVAGIAFGSLAWLAGIGVPRVAGWRLRARMRGAARPPGTVIVVDSR